jgi:hypothetical protein
MGRWDRVPWTQARQVAQLIDPAREDLPPHSVTPEAYFSSLAGDGRREEAVTFLGHALPRYEAVLWAAGAVRRIDPAPSPARLDARAAITAWIDDPVDATRRSAWSAGQAAPDSSPERLLGHAVFLSGGSIAPEDLPAVNPEPELAGRLAAAAVIMAAHRTSDAARHLEQALADGEAIAQGKA